MDVVKCNNTQLGRTDFYGRLFSIWQSSKIKDVMAVTILLVEKRSMGKNTCPQLLKNLEDVVRDLTWDCYSHTTLFTSMLYLHLRATHWLCNLNETILIFSHFFWVFHTGRKAH